MAGRSKPTNADGFKGAMRSMGRGKSKSPWAVAKEIKQAQAEREFGNGEVRGDRNWTPPVYGSTRDGRLVTISFGRGSRTGQTLVCDGHVSMKVFYASNKPGQGHDHYLVDGAIASKADRKRFGL